MKQAQGGMVYALFIVRGHVQAHLPAQGSEIGIAKLDGNGPSYQAIPPKPAAHALAQPA
jgi:hypothetical protein